MQQRCSHSAPSDSSIPGASCPACLYELAFAGSISDDDETDLRDSATPPPSRALPFAQFVPGSIVASRFRITALAGRGGMGEVYRADDLKLGQPVALKFMASSARSHALVEQTFYEEVRIGREISHPNVCRIYDLLEVEGRPAIVMELVDGEDLASLMRRMRIPYARAIDIARDLCAGLEAVHERGIVHGDLKPGNIMIDGAGRARISDFGLARRSDGNDTHRVAGTVAYMAPEQLATGEISSASDMYASGLILFEIFTGRPWTDPHSNLATPVDVHFELAADQPLLDPRLESAMIRCLHRDPAKRPSVSEVRESVPGDALDAAVAAGTTPSVSVVASSRKMAAMSRAEAMATIVLALIVLLAVGALSQRYALYGRTHLPLSPEELQKRARMLAWTYGLPDSNAGVFRFEADVRRLEEVLAVDGTRETLPDGPPAVILFHYRSDEAPRRHAALDRLGGRTDEVPTPGLVQITLTPEGRLQRLRAVLPENVVESRSRPIDWLQLVREAGFHGNELEQVDTGWRPPVAFDQIREWSSDSVVVRAAAYESVPTWFDVSAKERGDGWALRESGAADRIYFVLIAFFTIGGLILARRNLVRRMVDLQSTTRVSVWVFGCRLLYGLILIPEASGLDELTLLLRDTTASSLLLAAQAWLAYAAIEPNVRRRWPETLVGWTRVVHGRIRDSIVGRDLLCGILAGLTVRLIDQVRNVLPLFAPVRATPSHLSIAALGSDREAAGAILYFQAGAIFYALLALFVLVALRRAIANENLANLMWLMLATGAWSRWDDPLVEIPVVAAQMIVMLFVMRRLGLLALTAAIFIHLITVYLPITLDPGVFYFSQSAIPLSVMLALLLFACRTAIGTSRKVPLPRNVSSPIPQ